MNEKLLIHIPHASLVLPEVFWQDILKNREVIEAENVFMADYLIDKFVPKRKCQILKFNYSRMFCDVERFAQDEKEIMAKYGMGVVYLKDSNGQVIRKVNDDYRKMVIWKYYNKHHEKLDKVVSEIIRKYQMCYIIDLHAFSDIFVEKVLNIKDNPDICLGVEDGFYDEDLLDLTKNYFESYGYKVSINYPYSGSIVPNCYFNDMGKELVKSMMVEVNKRVYLDNNIEVNEEGVNGFKKVMDDFYELLNSYLGGKL